MLMYTFKGLETDHRAGQVTLIIALQRKVKSIVMCKPARFPSEEVKGSFKNLFLDLGWPTFLVNANMQLHKKRTPLQ